MWQRCPSDRTRDDLRTDVAREGALLASLDDDLASLVYIVTHGRQILNNLTNAIA